MNKTNKDVRDQYDFFQELMQEYKTVTERTIFLSGKKNNAYWLSGESEVMHQNSEDISLLVEKSKRDHKYSLKLKCPALTPEPFFRFDSDGPAHRNDNLSVPLEEQVITTPHFGTFNGEGKYTAYKNAPLLKPGQDSLIRADINFGTSLFCIETNCKQENGNFPEVNNDIPELDFQTGDETNFDRVTFA